ncbi:MAG: histidine kinase [Tannerellaceae bacterium]|jgi:LytS/YehU family sensor histidine kinase|nr:histidine kinase [Tannerellaceae bacterium]
MEKNLTKYWIFIIFWTAITMLISFASQDDVSAYEKGLNSFCFALGSILVTLPFSNKLFIRTLQNHKTLSFLIKFLVMSLFLSIMYVLLSELFSYFKIKGFLTSEKMYSDEQTFFLQIMDAMPGTMAASLLLCGILLYYEYSNLQKALLESQLQVLHAQINPHFMFNVLNYIHVLMQKDTGLASELLLKYSDTLRYQLYNGKQETVKLEQEVTFLKNFIDVEKFRWEDKVDVSCTWHIENGNKEIPPLILIPFIENAFKHVSRSTNEKGFIYINLEQRKRILSLKVENSKSNKPVKKGKEGGIGLDNIKKRLQIHYGERYSLTVKEMDTVYFLQLIICI